MPIPNCLAHRWKDAENVGRGERIRTSDPLVPNQVLYQAEPLPDVLVLQFLHFTAQCRAAQTSTLRGRSKCRNTLPANKNPGAARYEKTVSVQFGERRSGNGPRLENVAGQILVLHDRRDHLLDVCIVDQENLFGAGRSHTFMEG